jgi:hypothetical protein
MDPRALHLLWGEIHPNLIDDRFYRTAFAGDPLYLDSSQVKMQLLERFGQGEVVPGLDLSDSELLCVAKLPAAGENEQITCLPAPAGAGWQQVF